MEIRRVRQLQVTCQESALDPATEILLSERKLLQTQIEPHCLFYMLCNRIGSVRDGLDVAQKFLLNTVMLV